jgi:hypothetical protein
MPTFSTTAGIVATLAQILASPVPTAQPLVKTEGRIVLFAAGRTATIEANRPAWRVSTPPRQPAVGMELTPKVVCGMTVIPVPPSVDPGLIKATPTDMTYHIRTVTPPLCAD